jgi:signal transduction histidine kinase
MLVRRIVKDTLSLPSLNTSAVRPLRGIAKRFGDLEVRPKLMVLHNVFFLVLTTAVYLALIPPFEDRVARAKLIEVSLVTQMFAEDRPGLKLPHMASYDLREGSAEQVQVPSEVKSWLDAHPGDVWQNASVSDYLFRKDPRTGIYRRITLPNTVYDAVVQRAKTTLFIVLGMIYALAVIVLEVLIMPRYVYQPLRLMLDADRATHTGDRQNELIPDDLIPRDEIGQIMRSRNATVTELRHHEDELAAALSHLEAQDRLASLGLLSASVAHEMNTPLAVLHGSVEKLIETVAESHAQDRLQRMLRVTGRLRKLSESLVDFARVRKREMEHVALRPLMDEAWSLVAIDEKASEVRFSNLAGDRDVVVGNPDRLIQVFVNLLRNALDAVSENGEIAVTTRACMRDGKAWLAIMVDDDGRGIPADVLPEIFDAFVSSRLDSRGTGLGLTVAEGIIEQHGGTITASNRPGGGARLEVTLRSAA